ncbi:MAG: sulfite exporter TauE/SafE family protein [Candidatus Bathyarchaeia archaeon]
MEAQNIQNPHLSTLKALAALFFGFLMGAAAGLIGVGGGEFRIPILLYILGLSVTTAVAVNLLVGLLTVITSFTTRFQLGLFDTNTFNTALFMSLGSIVGAYIGALLTGRIHEKPLKKVLAIFLIIIGLKIGLEPFIHTPPLPLHFTLDVLQESILAVLVGVIIGIISGALGVAGGEFRIPVIIYLFSLDIKAAGTASLLVSIPTVAMGFIKHHQMGHTNQGATAIAIVMGAASIFGALVGALYATTIEKDVLKVLLGVILILATIRMITKP